MDLESIRIFVKVVQLGSFSKAAELLKLPNPPSLDVSRLESESGAKLILRTTRSVTPTAGGLAFYESCLGPVQLLEDARKSLQGQDSMVTGVVKITAPEDFSEHGITDVAAQLMRKHPGLVFDIKYTNAVLDLVKEGYDLAVRVGRLHNSRFKVRRVGESILVAVAAPEYLKKAGPLKEPEDLVNHDCLSYTTPSMQPRWALRSAKRSVTVPVRARVISNQMSSLRSMAIQGAGVALVPSFICLPGLAEGSLVRVLPKWSAPGLPVSIICPVASGVSTRLKLIMDQLAATLKTKLSVSD